MTYTALADPAARVRAIVPILRRYAAASEATRALTPEAHEALVSAGVFDLECPRSLGGEEVDLLTFVRVVQEAAWADGSGGWCAMISGIYAAFGGLLPHAGAAEVFGSGTTVIAGALSPLGHAVRVPGGYRVRGRWPFGSNSPHAHWFIGGAIVEEADGPVLWPNGSPHRTLVFVPQRDVTLIDTWTSTGLCGTGSHDYVIEDVFVPEARTFWFADAPREPGPLYALPWVAAYSSAIAAVPVGIAAHTLELYARLAPQKKPSRSPLTLQEKATVHDRVGVASPPSRPPPPTLSAS
jgi:alkylation response protein AidB-like acyl-CoA dehydrogenase